MAVQLYVCGLTWCKIDAHHCHRVRKALDDQGIEYELVTGPLSRKKRQHVEQISGQSLYPVIRLEDGSVYREASKDMAATIRAGRLFERAGSAGQPPA